ncbi:MAG TPA: sigma factor-like helix-turn-helix DNA-binding protein, partial [Vulgatibacter sp.]
SRLEAALARLPDVQRRTFLLAAVHGQPLEAIAAGDGVAVGTVKSRLHRARAELATILDLDEGGLP